MWALEKLKNVKIRETLNFEKIAEEWLEYKKNTVKQSTYYNYMFIINKYLNPRLKKIKLKKLLNFNYNELVSELTEELSKKTVRDVANVMKAILRYVEEKYDYSVKVKTISTPKVEIENLKVLSKKERNKLEKYCLKSNDLKCIGIVICLNTGLRIGEICALKWEDIDFNEKVIHIRKTLQRVYVGRKETSKIVIDKPKTKSSIRTIPISNKLYEILQPLKKEYQKEDYVLTGCNDTFLEPGKYRYAYKKILKESRIKEYKFHILRHTFATTCIEVGMDAKSLSEILGHSNVNITLGRYVHSSNKTKKKYLEKL